MDNVIAPAIIKSIDSDIGWAKKITVTCIELGSKKVPDTKNISVDKNMLADKKIYELDSLIGKEIVAKFKPSNPKKNRDESAKSPEELELKWNWWWQLDDFTLPEVEVTPTKSVELSNTSSTKYEVTSTQKWQQLCTNARTALMQAMSKHIENGQFIATTLDPVFEDSDLIFEYLNTKMDIDTPKTSMVEMLEAEGAKIQEIKDKSTWAIPPMISDGVEFKKACEENNLDQQWVLSQYQNLGIAKSTDYVQEGKGSYKDLLVQLLQIKDTESL
tara:strand:+ start:1699 stop:2517 length:819 start_codon:yes stop_codon:yes gene_type:complete